MDKPLYGSMVWVDDERGMTSTHVIDDFTFVIQGYESTGDEFEVRTVDGTVVFYYNHNLEGRYVIVRSGIFPPETVVFAALALADRMERSWQIGQESPPELVGRKIVLSAEDTLFMEGFLEHDDYPELPSEIAPYVSPDGTEGGTLRFYLVPALDVFDAERNLEASGA